MNGRLKTLRLCWQYKSECVKVSKISALFAKDVKHLHDPSRARALPRNTAPLGSAWDKPSFLQLIFLVIALWAFASARCDKSRISYDIYVTCVFYYYYDNNNNIIYTYHYVYIYNIIYIYIIIIYYYIIYIIINISYIYYYYIIYIYYYYFIYYYYC